MQLICAEPSLPSVNQGSRDYPDHIAEKGVAPNVDEDLVALPSEFDAVDAPQGRSSPAPGRAKGSKVMLTNEHLGGAAHGTQVQFLRAMPSEGAPHRGGRRAVENRIAVVFPDGVEARVEITSDLFYGAHRNGVRNTGVDAPPKPKGRDTLLCLEDGDLPYCVYARVSARGSQDLRILLGDGRYGLFQVLLNRGAIVLTLPATQLGTLVLDNELEGALRTRS